MNRLISQKPGKPDSVLNRIPWFTWISAVCLVALLFPACIQAQNTDLETGLHYYMIENLDTVRIELRGTTGNLGIAFDNIFLAPETNYRAWVLQANTLLIGMVEFVTPSSGEQYEFPDIILGTAATPDIDGDGLHDEGERIMGTNPNNADSDADGVPDGIEVLQGLDPLSGVPARTGILGSADTPGEAVDICASNDVVVVADSRSGIAVFNIFNGMNPVILAQVDTPGSAERVACADNLVAVADGAQGLTVIDINDPPSASITQRVSVGGVAQAVAMSAGVAYVGLRQNQVVSVDMTTGSILDRILIPEPVQDIRISGDYLFALGTRSLFSVLLLDDDLSVLGSVDSPTRTGNNKRFFIGDGIAYIVHSNGYNTIDIRIPEQLALIQSTNTNQFGWKQIVLNGSGLGIAAVSPNSTFDGPHHISLYDVTDPTQTNQFITEFTTPGVARAVTLFNGIAYVADFRAGMSVINYVQTDTNGNPPSIQLSTNFAEGGVEEGKRLTLSASVEDDIQVRNVEFYVDGRLVATDGNFPFEYSLIAPGLDQQPSITIRARASDTGGNATWTDEETLQILPDATPPRVVRISPRNQNVLGRVLSLTVFFNEPIQTELLSAGGFLFHEAGPDDQFDTADDVLIPLGEIDFREEVLAAFVPFTTTLSPGRYRLTVTSLIADLAGNEIVTPIQSEFFIYDPTEDGDADCVPDALEPLLGLDPDNMDSNGNGTLDGDEDFDSDGLSNCEEVQLFTDPLNADTDGDGIPDGEEDADLDGLFDGEEIVLGTNPADEDTDDDGWPDGAERDGLSDPLDANSQPQLFHAAKPPVTLVLPGQRTNEGSAFFTIARPPVISILPGFEDEGERASFDAYAKPPVISILPGFDTTTDGAQFNAYARPPVVLVLPKQNTEEQIVISKPPVQIEWSDN